MTFQPAKGVAVEVEVRLPQEGMGMTEAVLVEWRKSVGESVEKDDVIAEFEAAKATVEVTAPAAGRLIRLLYEPGDTVPVREVVAAIEATG